MIDIDKKYQTRDGRAVRLISNNGTEKFPIVGVVEGTLTVQCWTAEGLCYGGLSPHDLVPVSEKILVRVWANYGGSIHVHRHRRGESVVGWGKIVELEVPA